MKERKQNRSGMAGILLRWVQEQVTSTSEPLLYYLLEQTHEDIDDLNMPAMDYVIIPTYAQRLEDGVNIPISNASAPRILPKITTSLPHSDSEPSALSSPHPSVDSPSALSTSFNIPSLLLSSALPSGPVQSDPRHGAENGVKLLSTRNPLSIPITTANFRRFVAKVGPVFWLQDRIEEILLWKRGWKVTVVWMSVYAFLCGFHILT